MAAMPQRPKDLKDLKTLLKQYESVLTPRNRELITELIRHLEQGSDRDQLQDLAKRMQKAAQQQKR